jgi:hypothetical protein
MGYKLPSKFSIAPLYTNCVQTQKFIDYEQVSIASNLQTVFTFLNSFLIHVLMLLLKEKINK